MTTWAQPIGTGWVVAGEVPGPDVDEFAEPAEISAVLAGTTGASLLAVQHPHRTPEALLGGLSLEDALPGARRTLDDLLATAYREVHDVVAVYEVAGRAFGVLCLIEPDAVDDQVRHSEQVYPRIVAERAAMLSGLGRATSAALLMPIGEGADLRAALRRAVAGHPPTVSTSDDHRLWLVGAGSAQEELLGAVRNQPLLVADGNHRVAAAAAAGQRLLALVTTASDLHLGAIHRVLTGTGLTTADLAAAWRRHGLTVHEVPDPPTPTRPGTVAVSGGLVVELPEGPRKTLPRIDHGVVEDLLIADALGIDPAGPHVQALPDGHTPSPDADAVLRLAPVPLADVLAMYEQGRRMPRKSTYFTPKPRSGLLIAELNPFRRRVSSHGR